MWEINNSFQVLSFARSTLLGVTLCLFYDLFRIARCTKKFSVESLFFQDIVYASLSAILTFIFLLSVTNGEVRYFVLIGALLGFLICRFTFSVMFFKFSTFLSLQIKKILNKLFKGFYSGFDCLRKNMGVFLKKRKKTLKKLLKYIRLLLYTKEQQK